jgi:hypothetical protein
MTEHCAKEARAKRAEGFVGLFREGDSSEASRGVCGFLPGKKVQGSSFLVLCIYVEFLSWQTGGLPGPLACRR